jgi:hypothetical protein
VQQSTPTSRPAQLHAPAPDRFQRLLQRPRLGVWLAVIAVALSSPCLLLGFFLDEYTARYIYSDLPGAAAMYHSYSGGYGIATGDPADTLLQVERGWAPWWVNPQLLIALMRPLSEWTHHLDIRLWPDSAFMMRLHSLAWLFALVLIATRMYRRVLGPLVGGLAALLLAFDHTHGYSVGYIANRHALVSATFALLCLDQHARWRLEASRGSGALAVGLYVVALLGGESSVAIAAYLFGYALFVERGSLSDRALTFAPYFGVTLVWRIGYNALGFGARGSGIYIDPGREPLNFLAAFFERGPLLFLGQFFWPPAELYPVLTGPQAQQLWIFAVLFCLMLSAAFVPLLTRDRMARVWATGFLLALLPASTTLPNNRQLLLASIGAFGLLAQRWQLQVTEFSGANAPRAASVVWPTRLATWVLGLHLTLSPLLLPLTTCMIALTAPVHRGIVGGGDEIAGRDVVFVTAPDIFTTKFVQLERILEHRPLARRWRALSFGPQAVDVRREDARTLVLSYPDGVADTPFMEMFRDRRQRMGTGEQVQLEGLRITVVGTTDDGRLKQVRFEFDSPLDAPSFKLYTWEERGFVPFALPEIGQAVQLPAAHPQLGLKR